MCLDQSSDNTDIHKITQSPMISKTNRYLTVIITWAQFFSVAAQLDKSINLMTPDLLGDFEDDGWEGYSCSFRDWTTCINQSSVETCSSQNSTCRRCVTKYSKKNSRARSHITCKLLGGQLHFFLPSGSIFPLVEQFTIPPNVAIIGPANPNSNVDKSVQQTNISAHAWFIVPKSNTLCGNDPNCKDDTAKGPTACVGDPRTHRQGFLMSSNTTVMNFNFQGADLGRAASEGTLCGPGAFELPGCLSGSKCKKWYVGIYIIKHILNSKNSN